MNDITITKIISVQGFAEPFVFGPDLEDEALDDETCLEAVKAQVPNLANVTTISFNKGYDENGNKVWRAQLTPRAQTKGAR